MPTKKAPWAIVATLSLFLGLGCGSSPASETPPPAVVPETVPAEAPASPPLARESSTFSAETCPFPASGESSVPAQCPSWREGGFHHVVLVVRDDDLALTDTLGETVRFPLTHEGWQAVVAELTIEHESGSATLIATSLDGNADAIECARRAGWSAGFGHPQAVSQALWPIHPCRLTPSFVVEPSGAVHPPSPDHRIGEVAWRAESDVAGACHMQDRGRCQEYLRSNGPIQQGHQGLVEQGCREFGSWRPGTCPTEDLVGVCDRSERHGLLRYYYAGEHTTVESARARCDGGGVFRTALPR